VDTAAAPAFSPSYRRGAFEFAATVLRGVTWRAVLVTQGLGFMFALYTWLQLWHQRWQPPLLAGVMGQAIAALLVMLAAYAGDEAVRRGWSVWRAFVVVALCASVANVLCQWPMSYLVSGTAHRLVDVLNDFFNLGAFWGTVLVVFLNRRSAQRLLSRLRAGELERVHAEGRLIASRLAAAEAQIDPKALLRQLAEVRDLYAGGLPRADERLEALITGLREAASRSAAAQPYDT
jgi:hypothetical protein